MTEKDNNYIRTPINPGSEAEFAAELALDAHLARETAVAFLADEAKWAYGALGTTLQNSSREKCASAEPAPRDQL